MTSISITGGHADISPDCVRLNRKLWAGLILAQVAFVAVVLALLAVEWMPVRAHFTPQLVALDVMVLAMGIALTVLHRRYPELSGEPAHDRARYLHNILFPAGMLAAASTFGMVIVLLTGCIWPGTLVPLASLGAQLILWPPRRV